MPKIITTFIILFFSIGQSFAAAPSQWSAGKYLHTAVSQKKLLETAADHNWSINFKKQNPADTLLVLVLRVEFNNGVRDSSLSTTGNGLFGIRGGGDQTELKYYNADTIYKYDKRPHDSLYCASQLAYAADYFKNVSRGKLILNYQVLPAGAERAYTVPHPMIYYSPAGKKENETYDDYSFRKTVGLMHFVKDALQSAANDQVRGSPFATLTQGSDGVLRDTVTGRRVAIMLMHAGSSYLTDVNQDSPADMIDWFIAPPTFKFFKDSLGLSANGVSVGPAGKTLLIDEVMVTSETSNQDGYNWGVHGIIINQIARQLGIPDLFSTSSGLPGIGAFCIMDYFGYSAGKGFVPPYPSAWVRAFMGWDNPVVASVGASLPLRLKAVSAAAAGDTSILLVPINDHEYFLLENRQRNLGNDRGVYRDTSLTFGQTTLAVLDTLRLDSVVVTASAGAAHTIQAVKNYDVGLPASGVLVWHVDETIIRDRLGNNAVNADSTYRGVALVEADGVSDIGIASPQFYQVVFDIGGAGDVFPHTIISARQPLTFNNIGPFTRPSSRANDGGQTFLNLTITPGSGISQARTEATAWSEDSAIVNYVDTTFVVTVHNDYAAAGWPKACKPDTMFEPVVCDLAPALAGKELVTMSRHGLVYCFSGADTSAQSLGTRVVLAATRGWTGDTLRDSSGAIVYDTLRYLDSIAGPISFPTVINNQIYIPARDSQVVVLSDYAAGNVSRATLTLPAQPSSYLCNFSGTRWAVGCSNGLLVLSDSTNSLDSIRLDSASAICALAALPHETGTLAVIQENGVLSFVNADSQRVLGSVLVRGGLPPYTLVSGDLDTALSGDQVVVCDSRQGLWAFTRNGTLMPSWTEQPNTWASIYHEGGDSVPRSDLAINASAPALADINGDGYLDILAGGTNGIYALNYKGVLLDNWPAYLDKRYWYLRGDVRFTPAVGSDSLGKPLVLFSTMSGEHETYKLARIIRADRSTGTVVYVWGPDSLQDSITHLRPTLIDTLLLLNDSLAPPLVMWGGFVDAVTSKAVRPEFTWATSNVGLVRESYWPFSVGSPLATGPVITDLDDNDTAEVMAIGMNGLAYRWQVPPHVMGKQALWGQTGFNNSRTFAYPGAPAPATAVEVEPITFFSYPNPTQGSPVAVFKYKFSGPATDVRLDIFTYTGFRVYSTTGLSGSFPDYNEQELSLSRMGPGVYRCRMEARVNGTKHVKFWKMAVVK